jgi:hypothetical protein
MLSFVCLFVLCCVGCSTKTTRDGSIIGFWGGRAVVVGKQNRERESRGGEDDDRGGRAAADGRTDGGDAAEQNKSVW